MMMALNIIIIIILQPWLSKGTTLETAVVKAELTVFNVSILGRA